MIMNVQMVPNSDKCSLFKPKIPRPANSFMIYANENRKEMSQKFPRESNKDISKRLGFTWKSLKLSEKKKYFELARIVGEEHKKKYPNYVYNPKEARIRKAMRESSRDQTVGTAPTASPRGGRRSQTWINGPEEHLMMTPPPPDLGSQMCGNPIFPGHASSLSQFMPPMNGYTKLVHVLPSTGWLQDSPTYIQHDPMAELQQHQAHMWHQYQEPLRPCAADPSYMLDSHPPLYQETNGNDLQSHKKCKSQTDELLATKVIDENNAKQEKIEREVVDNTFIPTENNTVVVQNPFDGDDEMKLKKQPPPPLTQRNGSLKALPDFNEAFGSTERGRFQSPPDPRLAPNKSYLDSFLLNDGIKFYDYHA